MRILYVMSSLTVGSVEKVCRELISHRLNVSQIDEIS